MSRSVGIDIVELEEIKEKLSDKFVQRVLSVREQEKYHSIKNTERRLQYLAGRFAVKEAYTKVYNRFETPLNFTDVEVFNDANGAPYIETEYHPEDTLHVSISHSRNYVVAIVIKD
jgi:holo-[acyl-carrier protein] synthase